MSSLIDIFKDFTQSLNYLLLLLKFPGHISMTASGTKKLNFTALTILKLKLLRDFYPCVTFYILSVHVNEIYHMGLETF